MLQVKKFYIHQPFVNIMLTYITSKIKHRTLSKTLFFLAFSRWKWLQSSYRIGSWVFGQRKIHSREETHQFLLWPNQSRHRKVLFWSRWYPAGVRNGSGGNPDLLGKLRYSEIFAQKSYHRGIESTPSNDRTGKG